MANAAKYPSAIPRYSLSFSSDGRLNRSCVSRLTPPVCINTNLRTSYKFPIVVNASELAGRLFVVATAILGFDRDRTSRNSNGSYATTERSTANASRKMPQERAAKTQIGLMVVSMAASGKAAWHGTCPSLILRIEGRAVLGRGVPRDRGSTP